MMAANEQVLLQVRYFLTSARNNGEINHKDFEESLAETPTKALRTPTIAGV